MAMVGCAPSQVRLSGQVMFEGVPLPGGLVTFRPVDPAQNSVAAEIAGQGNYEVTLPVGEVLVSVDNSALAPRPSVLPVLPPGLLAEMSPEAKKALKGAQGNGSRASVQSGPGQGGGRYVPIPERYSDADTSNIKFTVQRGVDKKDILLTK